MKALDAWVGYSHRRAGAWKMSGFAEATDRLEESSSFRASDVAGGVELTTAAEIAQATDFDYSALRAGAPRVRQYAARPVGPETIRVSGGATHSNAPRSAIRQTCRVYALTDREGPIAEGAEAPVRQCRLRPGSGGAFHHRWPTCSS